MFPGPKLKAFFTDKVLEQKKSLPGSAGQTGCSTNVSVFLPVSGFGLESHGARARWIGERCTSVGGGRRLFGSEDFQGFLGEGELVLCVFHGGKVVLLFEIK
jgi:hypothetical protein